MITLPKKQTNQENKELQKLREDIIELQKNADKNFYWILLKQWLIPVLALGLILLVAIIIGIIGLFIILPAIFPEPVEPSKIEEISPIVFQAIVTINGLIIGFVPLSGFFFAREVRDRERGYEQDWEEEEKKSTGEKLNLTRVYYSLLLMLWHNVRTGVLRYTLTFVTTSVFSQFLSIFFYVVTMGYGMARLFILIDFVILSIVIFGLYPIIRISLYQPALKFVRYAIVEREYVRIEPEG